jgi:hypothetical protein
MMLADEVALVELTFKILGKLAFVVGRDFHSRQAVIEDLSAAGILTEEQKEEVKAKLEERCSSTIQPSSGPKSSSQGGVPSYAGCLGPEASESLRNTVMIHDTEKLLDRVNVTCEADVGGSEASTTGYSKLSESDFVTLVHQCRKRKWPQQVEYIYSFMKSLNDEGYPARDIPPQTQLKPSQLFFEAAMDTYFTSSKPEEAWRFLKTIMGPIDAACNDFGHSAYPQGIDSPNMNLLRNVDFVTLLVSGFVHCNRLSNAVAIYNIFRTLSATCAPSTQLARGLMRACGMDFETGVNILVDLCNICDTETRRPVFTDVECAEFVALLIESVAVLGQGQHLMAQISLLQKIFSFLDPDGSCSLRAFQPPNTLSRIQAVILAAVERPDIYGNILASLLMCTVDTGDPLLSHQLLLSLEQMRLVVPPLPFWHSLITEAFVAGAGAPSQLQFAASLDSLPFNGAMKVGAVKFIDTQKDLVGFVVGQTIALGPRAMDDIFCVTLMQGILTETSLKVGDAVDDYDIGIMQSFGKPTILGDQEEEIMSDASNKLLRTYWIDYCRSIQVEQPLQGTDTVETTTDNAEASKVDLVVTKRKMKVSKAVKESRNEGRGIKMERQEVETDFLASHSECELINMLTSNVCRFRIPGLIETLNAFSGSMPLICGLLYIQHLNARMLLIRHKTEKEMLSSQIRSALLESFCRAFRDTEKDIRSHAQNFVAGVFAAVLKASSYLGLQKQGAKLLAMIFDCVKCVAAEATPPVAVEPNIWKSVCVAEAVFAIQVITPCFDIVRELQKAFDIMSLESGRLACINCAMHNMLHKTEKIVRIVEFLKGKQVFEVISDAQRSLIEKYICIEMIEECESTSVWSAATTFLTSCKQLNGVTGSPTLQVDVTECTNIVRLLLSAVLHLLATYTQQGVIISPVSLFGSFAHVVPALEDEDIRVACSRMLSVYPVQDSICKLLVLCRRLLVRVECADLPEFRYLFESQTLLQFESARAALAAKSTRQANSDRLCQSSSGKSGNLDSGDRFMELRLEPASIIIVHSAAQLSAMTQRLVSESYEQFPYSVFLPSRHKKISGSVATTETEEDDADEDASEAVLSSDEYYKHAEDDTGEEPFIDARTWNRDFGVVGIDCEWRPYSSNSLPTKVSIVQIATPVSVYLFDMVAADDALFAAEFATFMETLMKNQSILKIGNSCAADPIICARLMIGISGYGLNGDIKRLKDSFPYYSEAFSLDPTSVLDLSVPASRALCARYNLTNSFQTLPASVGLSQLSFIVLGQGVDKSMQCSDWQRRPLLAEQITYAALDALVLLHIVTKLYFQSSTPLD